MTFTLLDPRIQKALEAAQFVTPTPIQEMAIPAILEGRDLLGSAHTGSGKTAAFLLPALERFFAMGKAPKLHPHILILVPTRELASQIEQQAKIFTKFLPKARPCAIYGGVRYQEQVRKLQRGCELLIATPGRLLDLIEQRKISTSAVKMLILDEADRMLDLGFAEAMEQLTSLLPSERQTLCFSATMKESVRKLAGKLLSDPLHIAAEQESQQQPSKLEQKVHLADNSNHKEKILFELLKNPSISSMIIFTATKRHADLLAKKLSEGGHKAAALHGDMKQRQRLRTISSMHKGKVDLLVATDVAARGIDIPAISHVINFDLPMSPEDYVHRVGRTARAGAEGKAISFVSPRDFSLLQSIERYLEQKISRVVFEGCDPSFTGEGASKSVSRPPRKSPKRNGHFAKKRFHRRLQKGGKS